MNEPGRGGGLLVVLAALIVAAFVIPYTLLRDMPSFAGAFLFWCGFGVAAIAIILAVLRGWRV